MRTFCQGLLLSAVCCAFLCAPSDAQAKGDSNSQPGNEKGPTRVLSDREKNGLMMVMFLMGVSGFGAFIAYASWASLPPKAKDRAEQSKRPSV